MRRVAAKTFKSATEAAENLLFRTPHKIHRYTAEACSVWKDL